MLCKYLYISIYIYTHPLVYVCASTTIRANSLHILSPCEPYFITFYNFLSESWERKNIFSVTYILWITSIHSSVVGASGLEPFSGECSSTHSQKHYFSSGFLKTIYIGTWFQLITQPVHPIHPNTQTLFYKNPVWMTPQRESFHALNLIIAV